LPTFEPDFVGTSQVRLEYFEIGNKLINIVAPMAPIAPKVA